MTAENIRLRSVFLFLACSQAVEQFKGQLSATFPTKPLSADVMLDQLLRKELGLLVRHWASRQIWSQLEANESDATQLNLSLLRLFTEGFKLPRDGSGLRYAELSTVADEANELGHRLTNALGTEHLPLLLELHKSMSGWREIILRVTDDALRLPTNQLTASVRAWAERAPESST